jgi:hypothetical protein
MQPLTHTLKIGISGSDPGIRGNISLEDIAGSAPAPR